MREPKDVCGACRFYLSNGTPDYRCRRYPPVWVGDKWRFTFVSAFDWCGEFQRRDEQ